MDITVKVEIINELRKNKSIRLSVSHLCKLFRITRDTYYKRLKRKSQVYKKQHLLKEKQIIKVFEDNNRVYGIEKLKKVLDQQGKYEISRQKVRQVIPLSFASGTM